MISLRAHMFRELVQAVGGFDAAAAALHASLGHTVSLATISRYQNGTAEVPWIWVSVLEDAAGLSPFTAQRARQMDRRKHDAVAATHIEALRETSEMVLALARAEGDASPEALAAAYAETQDVANLVSGLLASMSEAMAARRGSR
ncbi:MAG: hypothetical protein HWE26_17030 [Alteromonadaceae bacterium]|nr:hypothetical protein [Alteromonadaceae bacterium]